MRRFIFTLFICLCISQVQAQNTIAGGVLDTNKRVVTTAVPFAILSPDARSAGMGDAGVALSSDASASFWNPARTVFAERQFGVSLSYTPWLRKLVDDMSISYLSAFYKIDEEQAIDFGMTYFDLGDIQFTDQVGGSLGDYSPREFALRAHYSRKLSDNVSLAIGPYFIHSNIAGNVAISNGGSSGNQAKPGSSAGVDLGFFYTKPEINIGGKEAELNFGVAINNLGSKISYSDENLRDFVPTNLRLGTAATMRFDPYNRLTLAVDFNKLLVPTPPRRDSKNQIIEGEDPRDKTLLQGVFGSFADAPDGLKEDMQEFIGNIGLEYTYTGASGDDLFMVRTGYATEHKLKGGRKYFTAGIGGRYQVFGLDVAYLIPTKRNNPLSETLRFTLSLRMNGKKSTK